MDHSAYAAAVLDTISRAIYILERFIDAVVREMGNLKVSVRFYHI
jgi:hypothetical protein